MEDKITSTTISIDEATREIQEDMIQRSKGRVPIEIDELIHYIPKPVMELIDGLMFQIEDEIPKN